MEHESATVYRLAKLLLVTSNLDAVNRSILSILGCVFEFSQTQKLTVDLSLPSPLNLLVVGLGAVWVCPTHVTTEGLTMGKDFTTGLTNEFSVALLLNDLCLGDLSLFVGLLDIGSNLATPDDILAG